MHIQRPSQLTGRLRLRHLMEVTEAKGEEMAAERPRFERLAQKDSATRVVSAFNLFQTPEDLADELASLLDLTGRILEPSAGLGRLYRAIRKRSRAHITLIDISPDCCRELKEETSCDPEAEVMQADFLDCTDNEIGLFDAIIMNPPFKLRTDIRHIEHAMTLLAPGGRLVSLCADGPYQRKRFGGGDYRPLPAKSFASEGTGVNAAIVVIDR